MTLAPRFLVNLWVGCRVAWYRRHLRALGSGVGAQQTAFTRLMRQAAATVFGRQHGLNTATTYAQFQATVPVRTYDSFAPWVQRMAAGETGVLAAGPCPFFVETAATTAETHKLLPVPEAMLRHYRNGLRDALFLYALRAGHNGVFLGRHLRAGASTALRGDSGSYRTTLNGMLTLCLSPWIEANLHAPDAAIGRLPAGPEKDAAAARSMLDQDVTLLAGTPSATYALALAAHEAASDGKKRLPHLHAIWPNLECLLFAGAPLGLYAEPLRHSVGPTVNFHEVYLAAEGIIAAQDNLNPTGLRLLTDLGIFFEFLPAADYREESLAQAGPRCLPLAQVQPGIDYVLLLTTPAGLCRYVLGDVVRFLSVAPPRLQFVRRLHSELNLCGERVSEQELLSTLLAVCQHNGWQPVNFHVAPYVNRVAAGQTLTCHEWWLELRTHSMKTPTANVLGPELDAELCRLNPAYAARRNSHQLAAPSVRLVVPGLFDQWAQRHQKTAAASKMPRARADRRIADQLAVLAGFHQASAPVFRPADTQSPI